MVIVIEKNVPVVPEGNGVRSPLVIALTSMAIGDSFDIGSSGYTLLSVRTTVSNVVRRNAVRFSVRKYGQGYRCWRTK
jgi:hypothetical protein